MITKEDKETQNPAYTIQLNNDGLLTTWLLGTIEEEVLLDLDENCYAHQVWKSIKNKLLPSFKEKEVLLNETLMTLTKGNMSLDEYIQKFKVICDSLAAIKKPLDETNKVF